MSDRDHPFLKARMATPNNALDVQVRDDFIYVANGAEGLTVWKMIPVAGQHIDFPEISDASITDDPFPISATASSGLPVQFTVTGPAKYIDGNIVLSGGQGIVRVIATQPGNNNFVSASAERDFAVRGLTDAVEAYVLSKNPDIAPELTALDADPDNDGVPNLLEFFFRSNPVADSPDGHMTAEVFEFGGSYYLLAHYQKPRTSKYPLSIEVADFYEPTPRNWISYPADFDAAGHGDFIWLISNDGSFPLIRLSLKYP